MGTRLRNFGSFFLYGTVHKNNYYSSIEQIHLSNLKTLKILSFCLFIIHLVVCVSYYYLNILPKAQPLYLSVTVFSLAIFIFTKTFLKEHLKTILYVYYAYQIFLYAYSIYLGIFVNTTNFALIFCLLLFAIPVLIIDRPVRISAMSILATIVFCVMAVLFKKKSNLAGEITNALGSVFAGLTIFCYILNIKMHDISMKLLIEHERDTDSLTGLYNKKATESMINMAIRTNPDAGAFLILDLDDFKYINDTYGHQTGDDILFGMGFCIYNIFSAKDICGRFGGDEFIIYMNGIKDRAIIERYANRLQSFIQHEIILADCPHTVNCSIGISVLPDDGKDYSTLLVKADKALYHAKKSGKNKSCFYVSEYEHEISM